MIYSGRAVVTGVIAKSSLPAVAGMINFNAAQIVRELTDKSDLSHVPTFLDVAHMGWTWDIGFRDDYAMAEWAYERWIDKITIQTKQICSGTDTTTWVIEDTLVHRPAINHTWGNLGTYTLNGVATSILENGKRLEGNLPVIRYGNADNLAIFTGDTANHWRPGGVR